MKHAWIGLALALGAVSEAPGQAPDREGTSAIGKLMTHPSFLMQGDPRINPYAANRDDPWFRAWAWNQYMDQNYRSPTEEIGRARSRSSAARSSTSSTARSSSSSTARAHSSASRSSHAPQPGSKKQLFDRNPAYQSDRLTRYFGRHQAVLSPPRSSRGVPTEGLATKRR